MMKRVIKIFEKSLGGNHPDVATSINNLALLLQATNRLVEAEPLIKRALQIDEQSFGKDHPKVATGLNNLANLLYATNRLGEAEPLSLRHVEIIINLTRVTGHRHPHLEEAINNYTTILQAMGWSKEQIIAQLRKIAPEFFDK